MPAPHQGGRVRSRGRYIEKLVLHRSLFGAQGELRIHITLLSRSFQQQVFEVHGAVVVAIFAIQRRRDFVPELLQPLPEQCFAVLPQGIAVGSGNFRKQID